MRRTMRSAGAVRARGVGLGGVLLGCVAAAAPMAACGDLPVEHEFEPSGVMKGTVTYTGPLPCTQAGHVVGSAEILVFDQNLLPPPEGFGTTARSLATVAGDVLFAGVTEQLPANPDGSVACPPPGSPSVTVSAEWAVGPLPAGRYQARAFYDYDGDFSPLLKVHQLPTAGDVGGGALQNPAEAALGAKPIYQTISFGEPDASGKLVMPSTGAVVEGVTVNIGLVLPFGRPIAHFADVKDERPTVQDHQSKPADGPLKTVFMPADMRFSLAPTKNPAVADKEFIRLVLRAGLPDEEATVASRSPLSLQTVPPFNKLYLYASKSADGQVAAIPEESTPPLADLFPQALFARLDAADPTDQTPTASPAVLINGLVTPGSLLQTTAPEWAAKGGPVAVDEITVNLRPSVLCVTDPANPETDIYLVTPSLRSLPTASAPEGEGVIDDVAGLKSKLAARFRRDVKYIKVVEGCLPPGKYSTNLVYDTGQAWTMPNEAGVCQPPTEIVAPGDPSMCWQVERERDLAATPTPISKRPLLASQRPIVAVAGEQSAGFCDGVAAQASSAAPANGADRLDPSEYVAGVPRVCLPAAERSEAAVRKLMLK